MSHTFEGFLPQGSLQGIKREGPKLSSSLYLCREQEIFGTNKLEFGVLKSH